MKLKKVLIYLLCSIFLMLIVLLLSRDAILNYLVEKAQTGIKEKYHATLLVEQASFAGLGNILIKEIKFLSPTHDTIFSIGRLEVYPNYVNLILGRLSYYYLNISHIDIRIDSRDSIPNYAFLLKSKNTNQTSIAQNEKPENKADFGHKLNRLLNNIFYLISGTTIIESFKLEYFSKNQYRKYLVPDFESNGKTYGCRVFNLSQTDTIKWKINGLIKKTDQAIDFNMIRESANTTMVSLTGDEKSFKWLVDTLYFEARRISYKSHTMTIGLTSNLSNFQMNYWRIAPEDVSIKKCSMNLVIYAGEQEIGFDSTSQLSINSFLCKISAGYKKDSTTTYSLNVNTGKIPAANLFESLPTGMFSTLAGIKTKGEVAYNLTFFLNRENPDSLIFDSELKKFNFQVVKFGNDYLPKINDEFTYTAYDGTRPVRNFEVGFSNPDFTAYPSISNYLKSAVMTSEDGSFFIHGGFNEEAFRQSIATNIKQGRFARGGSTISMQLVKNIYLSRNKTISRKLEEALIVWLLEKNRLVSKERMFEVYLNIIEWGPNIYGIGEASRFYFSKTPAQLSLAESIYLSSIIPHPKYFKYSFDSTGQLKPFLSGYYRLVTDRMLRKNWIIPEDTVNLKPIVKLTGQALQFISPAEITPQDSTLNEELEFIN